MKATIATDEELHKFKEWLAKEHILLEFTMEFPKVAIVRMRHKEYNIYKGNETFVLDKQLHPILIRFKKEAKHV